jgi:quercetin dioxygenase-like cupin family protein
MMTHRLEHGFILLIALFTACKSTQKAGVAVQQPATVFAKGEKITNNNFTGIAYLQPLVASDSLNQTSVGSVTFEPGARTNWHYHPGGQVLLVVDGVGYYQEKGTPKRILRKGDAVKCPPGVLHWHGASASEAFVQVAITNTQKGAVVWLQPVTNEEYIGNSK